MKMLGLSKVFSALIVILVISFNANVNAQRTHHDIEREETLRRVSNI